MEMGEQVAVKGLSEELRIACPFTDPGVDQPTEEDESVAFDDDEAATVEQENDGGKLGRNLVSGSHGPDATVKGPCPAQPAQPVQRRDTRRTGERVWVPGADGVDDGMFPFAVAAHHLIPGEASLAPSVLKQGLMTKGGAFVTGGRRRTVKAHIGYNVNGAHNGVWLPGNYAIRAGATAVGGTWSEVRPAKPTWARNYVAAVSARASGQFHDAHTNYSAAVKRLLKKLHAAVVVHECGLCQQKTEVPPPYVIKLRLYALSGYLHGQLSNSPGCWRRPWFVSDSWRDEVFVGRKPWKEFYRMYRTARSRGR